MGFYDQQFQAIEDAVSTARLAAENDIAARDVQIANDAVTISGLNQQIAILTQQLSAEAPAFNSRVLTTANPWIDETPFDGSPQPSAKPVIVQDADGTQIAVSIPNGSSLFVRKFGPQPGITNISYCFQRQFKGTGKLKLWESDLIITAGGKKWNGSFQLRFDLGTIQIWKTTWIDTGLKHGITDSTKLTSIQINFQKRPDGIFYDSVVINGNKFSIQALIAMEDTNWGDQFLLQLQFMLDSGAGEDVVSGITPIVA